MSNNTHNKDINEKSEITLLKDYEWSVIDEELCRVIDFTPLATVKNGKVIAHDKRSPYGSVSLECKKLPAKVTGFICHRIDFMHLWIAFRERKIKQDEEVLIFWTKKHYKKIYKIFSAFMPRLWVMICPKGAYQLRVNPNYKPEITGEARWNASSPIIDWKPEVME